MITGFIDEGRVLGRLPSVVLYQHVYNTQKMIFITTEPKDANTKYERNKFSRFSFIKAYHNLFLLNCRTSAARVNLPCIYELIS